MKQMEGYPAKLHLNIKGKDLYFTAQKITEVNNTHISFTDRHNKNYSFRKDTIIEIQQVP